LSLLYKAENMVKTTVTCDECHKTIISWTTLSFSICGSNFEIQLCKECLEKHLLVWLDGNIRGIK
jgi:hypothetical protein